MAETRREIGLSYQLELSLYRHFWISGRVAFIIIGPGQRMLEQHWLNLLVKLAVSAALASILTRVSPFQRMLMREERTLPQRVHMALVGALLYGAGVATRVL